LFDLTFANLLEFLKSKIHEKQTKLFIWWRWRSEVLLLY